MPVIVPTTDAVNFIPSSSGWVSLAAGPVGASVHWNSDTPAGSCSTVRDTVAVAVPPRPSEGRVGEARRPAVVGVRRVDDIARLGVDRYRSVGRIADRTDGQRVVVRIRIIGHQGGERDREHPAFSDRES